MPRTTTCSFCRGAGYLDQEVVVDGNLITSRFPPDLPAFCREVFAGVRQAV